VKFAIEPDERVAEGLVRLMRGQIRKLREMAEPGAEDPAEFVRRARVAAKRIRAALQLARPLTPRKTFRRMNGWWRSQGRALSETRDAAARLEALQAIGKDLEMHLGPALVGDLRERFTASLEEAQADPAVERFRAALTDAPAPDPHTMRDVDADEVLAVYAKCYSRARKAMAAAAASGEIEAYHAWRKAAKRHALQTRLLRRLSPAIEMRTGPTRALAETLGGLQDIAVVQEAVTAMSAPPGGTEGRDGLLMALRLLEQGAMDAARREGEAVFALRRRDFLATLTEPAQAQPAEPTDAAA
jgi:CHAD domain-containing protein